MMARGQGVRVSYIVSRMGKLPLAQLSVWLEMVVHRRRGAQGRSPTLRSTIDRSTSNDSAKLSMYP